MKPMPVDIDCNNFATYAYAQVFMSAGENNGFSLQLKACCLLKQHTFLTCKFHSDWLMHVSQQSLATLVTD